MRFPLFVYPLVNEYFTRVEDLMKETLICKMVQMKIITIITTFTNKEKINNNKITTQQTNTLLLYLFTYYILPIVNSN